MEGEQHPDTERFASEVAGPAKPGEESAMLPKSPAMQYAIGRELQLVAGIRDPDTRAFLEGAIRRRYEARVQQIRHDTRTPPARHG